MLAHNFLSLIKDHSCHWEVFGSTSGKLQTRNVKKNKEIYFSPLTRRPEREVCNSATPQCLWELLSSSLSHYSAMFGCGGFFLVLKLEAPDVTIPYRSTTTNQGEERQLYKMFGSFLLKERFLGNYLHKTPQMSPWSHSFLMPPTPHPLQAGWESVLAQLTQDLRTGPRWEILWECLSFTKLRSNHFPINHNLHL